jgi:hypothetical protein
MIAVTRRMVFGLITAGAAAATFGQPVARAADEKPLTPEAIVAGGFTGRAVVEFTVGEVAAIRTGRSMLVDESLSLHIVAASAGKQKSAVYVLVSWETATRLKQLGIEDPAEHFRGKTVRVSGALERHMRSSVSEYYIKVTSLDQFKVIRKQ